MSTGVCRVTCTGGVQALAALFLMNNVHYIVKAVESSEALSVVGQDWIERHKDLIEQYGEEYQASSAPCWCWGVLKVIVIAQCQYAPVGISGLHCTAECMAKSLSGRLVSGLLPQLSAAWQQPASFSVAG